MPLQNNAAISVNKMNETECDHKIPITFFIRNAKSLSAPKQGLCSWGLIPLQSAAAALVLAPWINSKSVKSWHFDVLIIALLDYGK